MSTALYAAFWMMRDTVRQSFASRLFWAMLAVSVICILFCLSVRVKDYPRPPLGPGDIPFSLPKDDPQLKQPSGVPGEQVDVIGHDELSLGFGAFTVSTQRSRSDSVRFLQVWLAGMVAGTAGIFLAIIWTSGFLPTFLDPNHATVLLAKPVPRWSLLAGKVLGVLTFVFVQASVFVIGTWFALGVGTGEFDARYLLAIPVLLLHFAVFYSFSAMLAVWTRNTVVCVFGTLLFWVLCWGMNFGRHAIVAHEPKGLGDGSRAMLEIGYWVLPKPGDLNMIFDDALDAKGFAAEVPEFARVRAKGQLNLFISAMASIAFAMAMYGIAARELKLAEY